MIAKHAMYIFVFRLFLTLSICY